MQAHPGARRNAAGVLLHCGATVLWPDGRTANFDCGFDAAVTQTLMVLGTGGSVSLHDLVIPCAEEESSFVATHSHGWGDIGVNDVTRRDLHTVGRPLLQAFVAICWEYCGSMYALSVKVCSCACVKSAHCHTIVCRRCTHMVSRRKHECGKPLQSVCGRCNVERRLTHSGPTCLS